MKTAVKKKMLLDFKDGESTNMFVGVSVFQKIGKIYFLIFHSVAINSLRCNSYYNVYYIFIVNNK